MVQNGCKIRSFLPIFSLFGCFFPCFVDGISNIYIDSRYIGKFKNIGIDIDIDKEILENIDIDIDIDKDILENIDIDINIDKEILENIDIDIDIDKEILENIDIDKISNRLEFGISNRASC